MATRALVHYASVFPRILQQPAFSIFKTVTPVSSKSFLFPLLEYLNKKYILNSRIVGACMLVGGRSDNRLYRGVVGFFLNC